jgi:hypothetical protein
MAKSGQVWLLCQAMLVCWSSDAFADSCALDASTGEAVTIAGADPAGVVRLADGRLVRLAGLDQEATRVPAGLSGEATLVETTGPDRHGQVRGDLFVDGTSLSRTLVSAGAARVRPVPGDRACYATLLAEETTARRSALGLWSEPGYSVADASDAAAVARLDGTFAIVAGHVRHVGSGRDRTWIDFGKAWREDVTVVISQRDLSRFVAAGQRLQALEGGWVRVRGIVAVRDGPVIEVTEPAALERLPDGETGIGR